MKRVQLTSGDHRGKNSGRAKEERRAATQNQWDSVWQNIRNSEQARKARKARQEAGTRAVEPSTRSTDRQLVSAEDRLASAYAALQARVSEYAQALEGDGSWSSVEAEAGKVVAAAAELEAATKVITASVLTDGLRD